MPGSNHTVADQNASYSKLAKLPLELRRIVYRGCDISGTYILYGPKVTHTGIQQTRRACPSLLIVSKAIGSEVEVVQYDLCVFRYKLWFPESFGLERKPLFWGNFQPMFLSNVDLTKIKHIKIELCLLSFGGADLEYRAIVNSNIMRKWDSTIGAFVSSLPNRKTCVVTTSSDRRSFPYLCNEMVPGSAVLAKVQQLTGFESVRLVMASDMRPSLFPEKRVSSLGTAFFLLLIKSVYKEINHSVWSSLSHSFEVTDEGRFRTCGEIEFRPGKESETSCSQRTTAADCRALAAQIEELLRYDHPLSWYRLAYESLTPLLNDHSWNSTT